MKKISLLIVFVHTLLACTNKEKAKQQTIQNKTTKELSNKKILPATDSLAKTIHVLIALCDNKHQGIVPVPASLGNGQQPNTNLYWGAAFGLKTYFTKSQKWQLIEQKSIDSIILERLIFKHKTKNYYLIADAYNGKFIKQATKNFLHFSAGQQKKTIQLDKNTIIASHGNANLIAYLGHNGLMDFKLHKRYTKSDNQQRDIIILACYSKNYFQPHLQHLNVNRLLWTTGFMAPEAYTLHDALTGYVLSETNEQIRDRAAQAYHHYQKCGLNAAKRLLVTTSDTVPSD